MLNKEAYLCHSNFRQFLNTVHVKESFLTPHDNKRIHEYGTDLIIIVSTNKPQHVCIKYKNSELDYPSLSILKYYIGCWNNPNKMNDATKQIVNNSTKLNALWINKLI